MNNGVSYLHGRKPDSSYELPPAKPIRVLIQFDRYKATLNLPVALDLLGLSKIYALLKMLKERPEQNENAHEIFDQFFPEWEKGFMDAFNKAALKQWDAGEYAEWEIREVKRKKAALERCRKIVKAYNETKPKTKELQGA